MSGRMFFFPSTVRVCIDHIDEYEISGRVYCKMKKEPILFHDFNEFLLKVDALFDEKGFPQSFQEKKEFGRKEMNEDLYYCYRPEMFLTDQEMKEFQGEERTLDVIIQSRCHTSWQGFVIEDEKIIGSFDGEIGLLKYFESADTKHARWKINNN